MFLVIWCTGRQCSVSMRNKKGVYSLTHFFASRSKSHLPLSIARPQCVVNATSDHLGMRLGSTGLFKAPDWYTTFVWLTIVQLEALLVFTKCCKHTRYDIPIHGLPMPTFTWYLEPLGPNASTKGVLRAGLICQLLLCNLVKPPTINLRCHYSSKALQKCHEAAVLWLWNCMAKHNEPISYNPLYSYIFA